MQAGKWGAGGTQPHVDTMISMCIKSHTLVCSQACNSRMNGTGGEANVVLLVWRSFSSFGLWFGSLKKSLIIVEIKQERCNVAIKICVLTVTDGWRRLDLITKSKR